MVWAALVVGGCNTRGATSPAPAAARPWVVRGNACPFMVSGRDALGPTFPGCGTPPLDLGFAVCPPEGCPRPCARRELDEHGAPRPLAPDRPPLSVTYDDRGRPRTLSRGRSSSELTYDAEGRLESEQIALGPIQLPRRYVYDGDRVIAVVSRSSRTSYTYDQRGRVMRAVLDAPHHAPVELVLRYDGDRLLEQRFSSGRGMRIVFEYDCRDDPSTRTAPPSSALLTAVPRSDLDD